jgi:hypothetical protein
MQLQHLVLGFELELYAPEEFCMMYWCASWPHMRRDTPESRSIFEGSNVARGIPLSCREGVQHTRNVTEKTAMTV